MYAFSTPGNTKSKSEKFVWKKLTKIQTLTSILAPLLSREAARKAEDFVFSICVGDDLFMNFTVDIVEDLRTDLVEELQLCRLPKVKQFINAYTEFSCEGILNFSNKQ